MPVCFSQAIRIQSHLIAKMKILQNACRSHLTSINTIHVREMGSLFSLPSIISTLGSQVGLRRKTVMFQAELS